jgi:molybdopterin-containing oxidoreductase family iron-sulfur binding subunit
MVIDLDRCAACQACTVACRAENNVPFAGPEQAAMGRAKFWNELLCILEARHDDSRLLLVPMPCMHCEDPPCIKVCPVGATYQNDEGVVGQIHSRCIGCRYCTVACPYTRRFFNWFKPVWPPPMDEYRNPDVSIRPKGVVEKCTFCAQRLRRAREAAAEEGRPLAVAELQRLPACCQTCPTGARVFGDLDDPGSRVSQLARSKRAFRLQEDLGTHPKVIYLKEDVSA